MKTLDVLDKVLRGKRLRPATQRQYREALTQLAEYEDEFPVSGQVINEWINWLADKYHYGDMTLRTSPSSAVIASKPVFVEAKVSTTIDKFSYIGADANRAFGAR